MRYDEYATEGVRDWVDKAVEKGSELLSPAERAARAQGKMVKADVDHNYKELLASAVRYTDPQGRPISSKTLHLVPMRAIYSFMAGLMNLSDKDIDWVGAHVPDLPKAISAAELNSDRRLDDLFAGTLNASDSKKILRSFAQSATTRKYEKIRLAKSAAAAVSAAAAARTAPPSGGPASGWRPGDAIVKRDGTVISPSDPNYAALARQYSMLIAAGII